MKKIISTCSCYAVFINNISYSQMIEESQKVTMGNNTRALVDKKEKLLFSMHKPYGVRTIPAT